MNKIGKTASKEAAALKDVAQDVVKGIAPASNSEKMEQKIKGQTFEPSTIGNNAVAPNTSLDKIPGGELDSAKETALNNAGIPKKTIDLPEAYGNSRAETVMIYGQLCKNVSHENGPKYKIAYSVNRETNKVEGYCWSTN